MSHKLVSEMPVHYAIKCFTHIYNAGWSVSNALFRKKNDDENDRTKGSIEYMKIFSKMHLHLRHSRGVDSKGRVHITADEMAEIYRNFHAALNETYWETASNHKICTDAMETLKTTHISKKNGRFLVLFTSVLSEAYSHAHYNVQELLYDDRDHVRADYWAEVQQLYKAVMAKADKVHAHSKCCHQLALLLHFASLYSLYKDVADEEFIISLYKRAENYILNDHHRFTESETEQIREYHEAIQTIYHLRGERRCARAQTAPEAPEEAPTLVLSATDVLDAAPADVTNSDSPLSRDELYAIYDKALERHKKMVMKRQQTLEELEKADIAAASLNSTQTSQEEDKSSDSTRRSRMSSSHSSVCSAAAQPVVLASETELELVIKNLNPVPAPEKVESVKEEESQEVENSPKLLRQNNGSSPKYCPERRNTVASVPPLKEFAGKDPVLLDKFDFVGEFERRCGRKKTVPAVGTKLPLIGRSNKDDMVHSYRRKALFDDVGYRQPPNLHKIHSLDNPDYSPATRPHTIFTYEEEDIARDAEDVQNNNLLTPNAYMTEKIIRAVLAEKPVSPISSHRRLSMIS
ncbi:hypothetical protein Y032_0103g3536 [Ancylostoma ceylanicum]|uniref:Uncharacterized protein n=2 Tax=Ancylostoma ceylanicum TaxID=53326 RepID=A0A016TGY1_9BILA|nr:hypothetical protein Y032_0103g3536 [Ancylostoma ceylanicum]